MKKLIFLFSGLIIFIFQPLICSAQMNENLKNRSSDVRLQENGWIRILDSYVTNQTMEEKLKNMNWTVTLSDKKEIIRELVVKVQFLKPCIATKKIPTKGGQGLFGWSTEETALFMLSGLNRYAVENDMEKWGKLNKEYEKFCEDNGIDSTEFMIDMTVPKFRCDYRIKAFATFYSSKGFEVKTIGEIPIALIKDSYSTSRKTEMLPGENTYVTFHIPDDADSWNVWVPK